MRLPVITGTIDRRILVNYRVDPRAIEPLLPAPFRPKLVRGWAVGGICLIRLCGIRPRRLPRWLGLSSENAAHRIAVEWDTPAGVRDGVFIRRRDTNSRLNCLAGGRLFPGVHHHARFNVHEGDGRFEIEMQADDGGASLAVAGELASAWPGSELFDSLDGASAFFAAGSLGYSPTVDSSRFQGMELACRDWRVEPLVVKEARSSLFDDRQHFPPGAAFFDCALLMRGIEHEWHGRDDLCCTERNATEGVAYSVAVTGSCAMSGKGSPIAAS